MNTYCHLWPTPPSLISIFFSSLLSYVPTRLWGFSGHVQTVVQSVIGRMRCPWPIGERVYIALTDGSTLTYDLYEPMTSKYEGNVNP